MSVNENKNSSIIAIFLLIAGSMIVQVLQDGKRKKDVMQVRKTLKDVDMADAGSIADAYNRLRTD